MNTINNVAADVMIAKAKAMAAITSPALETAIVTVANAKEEWSGAPITLYVALSATMTPDQLDELPVIGSESGNNPDIVKVPSEKKGGKPKDISFYVIWADNTPEGVRVCNTLRWLGELNKAEGDTTGCPAELSALTAHERAVMVQRLTRRRASIRSAYKTAVKLYHQLVRVNELEGCHATLIPGVTAGTYENSILVRTTVTERMYDDYMHYNVSQFLRLNADKAEEKDSSFAALKETLKREKPPAAAHNTGDAAPQLIRSTDTYGARMGDVNEYLNTLWSAPADYGNFIDKLGKDDNALLNTFDVFYMLKDVAAMDLLAKKYGELKEAANKVAKAA